MEDDQTEQSEDPSHEIGTRKGEEMASEDSDLEGEDTGTNPVGRPTGTPSARFSTGINPEDEQPIDPDSPNMPPP